jgi:hypothetical protein
MQMNNKVITTALIGIGFTLCFVAVCNTAIMFYLNRLSGLSNSLIYSEVNIATAAIGMAVMFIGKYLKNVDKRLTKSLDRNK